MFGMFRCRCWDDYLKGYAVDDKRGRMIYILSPALGIGDLRDAGLIVGDSLGEFEGFELAVGSGSIQDPEVLHTHHALRIAHEIRELPCYWPAPEPFTEADD